MSNIVPTYDIFDAIEKKDIVYIKTYIDNKQNLEVIKDYRTLLLYSLLYDEDIAFMFIEAGSNIYAIKANTDSNLLICAANSNKGKIVQYCLNKSFDVNKQDKQGNIAIYWFIVNCNIELTTLLIEAKSDINHINKCGNAPLFDLLNRGWASGELKEKSKMVMLLLDNNVVISKEDWTGDMAIDYFIDFKIEYYIEDKELEDFNTIINMFLDNMILNKIESKVKKNIKRSEELKNVILPEILKKIIITFNKPCISDLVKFMMAYDIIDDNDLLCISDKYGIISMLKEDKKC